jgi:hypothetical protein
MLEHTCHEGTATAGRSKLIGRSDDRRDVRGETFRVQIGHCLTIDQESVTTEDDRGFDAIAMADGSDEFANRRHARALPMKSRAKHNFAEGVVKRAIA